LVDLRRGQIEVLDIDTLVRRGSSSRDQQPDIDLSGPVEDPGVSRAHAMLERQTDGSYVLLAPGPRMGRS